MNETVKTATKSVLDALALEGLANTATVGANRFGGSRHDEQAQ